MINIEAIKILLQINDEKFVKPNDLITPYDLITIEVIDILSKYKNFGLILEKYVKKNPHLNWQWESICSKCNRKNIKNGNKTKLVRYIAGIRCNRNLYVCDECLELQKSQDNDTLNSNTLDYIKMYLTMDKSWNIPPYKWFRSIVEDLNKCNKEIIIKYIKNMKYYDFLNTLYWKAITQQVRYKASFKCQLCNSNNELHIHHRDYSIHGYEHDNLKELICLCKDCHTKYHNIEKV